MEGDQYQIRTMARDVEEAERAQNVPVPKPQTFRVERMPPEELTDKTAEVRKNDVERVREERKLEEILYEARRRIEVPPIRPKKTLEDILPIEPLPPPNLPVAEVTPRVSPRVEEAVPPPRETPEEILGLPLAPSVPTGEPPKLPERPRALPRAPQLRGLRGLPTLKFALFTTFLSIALIAISFGAVKLFSGKEQPAPPLPPSSKVIEQPFDAAQGKPLPQALFRYDEIRPIEISELSYDALKSAIDALQGVVSTAGTFLYIPIKYSSEKEIRYLGAEEFFRILQVYLPPPLALAKDFSLFLSIQPDAGPRLGFVMAVPEIDENSMKEWKKTIVEDLRPLIFGMAKREEGALFRRGFYKNFETHFINLPIPTTSVDWILAGDNLVVATSKDSARAALDRLLNQ